MSGWEDDDDNHNLMNTFVIEYMISEKIIVKNPAFLPKSLYQRDLYSSVEQPQATDMRSTGRTQFTSSQKIFGGLFLLHMV